MCKISKMLHIRKEEKKVSNSLTKSGKVKTRVLKSIASFPFHYVIQLGEDIETKYRVQMNMSPKF